MAQIYSITARFMRKIQVREYEPAEAELTASAELLEGESLGDAIKDVFSEVTAGVHEALGLPPDTRLRPRVGTTVQSADGQQTVTVQAGAKSTPAGTHRRTTAPVAAKTANVTVPAAAASDLDIPSTPAAKPAAQPAKAAAQPQAAAAVVDIDPTGPAAQPAQPAAQQTAALAEDVSKMDVAKYVGDLVRNGKVNSNSIKTLYPQFSVQRIADLKPEQKGPFKEAVDKLVKAAADAASL